MMADGAHEKAWRWRNMAKKHQQRRCVTSRKTYQSGMAAGIWRAMKEMTAASIISKRSSGVTNIAAYQLAA